MTLPAAAPVRQYLGVPLQVPPAGSGYTYSANDVSIGDLDNSNSTALLIFTTTIPAQNRLYTFLHDPQYRVALAWQNVAYNQPPPSELLCGARHVAAPRAPVFTRTS